VFVFFSILCFDMLYSLQYYTSNMDRMEILACCEAAGGVMVIELIAGPMCGTRMRLDHPYHRVDVFASKPDVVSMSMLISSGIPRSVYFFNQDYSEFRGRPFYVYQGDTDSSYLGYTQEPLDGGGLSGI